MRRMKASSCPGRLSTIDSGKKVISGVYLSVFACVPPVCAASFVCSCSSIFKKLCVWLNRRKWLWLPQEMGRGNTGDRPLWLQWSHKTTHRREREWEGGKVGGLTEREILPFIVRPLTGRRTSWKDRKKARSSLDIKTWARKIFGFGFGVEMRVLLGALSALICCSLSSHTLDPAGRNVCHNIRYTSTLPSLTPVIFSLLCQLSIFLSE